MDMMTWGGDADAAADPAELLARADALRDNRDWNAAAEGYAAFLRLRPRDWGIRVQYGHCLKEAGDPHAALLAYREAERQCPHDSDIHLQIGHALKLLGRQEEAVEEYARALTLDPANDAARGEFLALHAGPASAGLMAVEPPPLPVPAEAPWQTGAGSVVFDASDLLDYFRHNRAPTGIQRVQLNIIREALDAADAEGVAIAGFCAAAGQWKPVPPALFLRLALLSREGSSIEDAAWRGALQAVEEALRDGAPLDFPPGCSLVNLGTSWWIPDYLRLVRQAQARSGLRYIPFIHDCIPLLVPEHCSGGLVDEFARWFASVCLHADAVLTNSDCTRADFRRALNRLLPGLDLPCFTVPLNAADPPAGTAALPPMLRSGRPYVLFVGTIESRKNHLLAFNAWLSLLRRHGAEAVPDLVCVGKQGWLAEAALQLHRNSAALRAKVHLLHGVPDTELGALYRGCLFTLYNSFYEGWGLPVTESLAAGKVPLVPDHSSLREAGQDSAVYFVPQSEPDLVAKLERLIFEPGFRAAQEAVIAAAPPPRPWAALAADIRQAVREAGRLRLPAPRERLRIELGAVHPLRLLPGPEPSLAMGIADVLRDGEGWSRLEEWGVWTCPGQSLLRLPLAPQGEAGRLRLYLEMLGPPEPVSFRIRAGLRGAAPGRFRSIEAGAGEALFCMLEVELGMGGEVEIEIETDLGVMLPGRDGTPDRQVGIGLRSLMACRRDDLAARLDYLERLALPRMVEA
ncbi:glycosyltransferase family 4 protein [Belnapia rosea]|uniref:glycosyltransferase family 4 protein n=1 Tax=Belnapia rosea TaxID=938405 RepID=UPI00087F35F1|nr:glycosyltransferase [Belnapia rosea]SDB09369.1 Glycosyltransferase involved in cell wall bisynthesis [Belnapia rosea]